MAKIDLDSMALDELKLLQREVNKAVSGYEEKKRREALAALEEKARELGFSMAELTGTKVSKPRSASVAKFANPANEADTWTGRGRKPKWFLEAIAAGRTEEELAI